MRSRNGARRNGEVNSAVFLVCFCVWYTKPIAARTRRAAKQLFQVEPYRNVFVIDRPEPSGVGTHRRTAPTQELLYSLRLVLHHIPRRAQRQRFLGHQPTQHKRHVQAPARNVVGNIGSTAVEHSARIDHATASGHDGLGDLTSSRPPREVIPAMAAWHYPRCAIV